MKITVLTLFKDFFNSLNNYSIVGRAIGQKILELEVIDIRDYTKDKHLKVDDYPYGGGRGMVLKPQPAIDCINSIKENAKVFYLSPKGKRLDQKKVIEMSKISHVILLNGHYEGIDQRIIDSCVDEEISLGDYVLTGGEIASFAIIDAISRLLPGVLNDQASYIDESHYNGLLEYPQYTRPSNYEGMKVPEILLSGDHEKIRKWRLRKSIEVTLEKRPDLIEIRKFSEEEEKIYREILKGGKTDGYY